MKRRKELLIAKTIPLIALLGGIAFSIKSCYLTYGSMPSAESPLVQYIEGTGTMEYTKFKDGLEELKFTGSTSNKTYVTLCHNFDNDDTIDQVKSFEKLENSLNLEQVLERKKDFEANRHLFETADKLLLKFRKKN